MAERIFFVQLNLDEMSAQLDVLDSTTERGEWLEGFRAGTRGSQSRETWSEPKRMGHAFGIDCLDKAEEFQRKKSEVQAERGRKSAEARRARFGSAQPNQVRTTPEPRFEPDSNHGSNHGSYPVRTAPEPKRITNNEQREENKEQRTTAPSAGVGEVFEFWNTLTLGTNLPQARPTPPRAKAIATRLKEKGWLEDFRAAVSFVVSSDWHRGANDRNWIADLDFLLRPGKATQLAEKTGLTASHKPTAGKPQWNGFGQTNYEPSERKGQNGETLI